MEKLFFLFIFFGAFFLIASEEDDLDFEYTPHYEYSYPYSLEEYGEKDDEEEPPIQEDEELEEEEASSENYARNYTEEKAHRVAHKVEREIINGELPERLSKTIEAVLKVSRVQLRRFGQYKLAKQIDLEWRGLYRDMLFQRFSIGNFDPLSDWLALTYEAIEMALIEAIGKDMAMKILVEFHIADIKTLNFCSVLALNPCNGKWTKKDFVEHMVSDGVYHGLYPVLTYWAVQISCTFGTMGTGAFFICAPLGWGAEMSMEKWIAPRAAPWVYDQFCG